MNHDDILLNYCKHHQIRIVDRNKRIQRYNKIDPRYFTDSHDYNKIDAKMYFENEPLYTVEIPLSELIKIAEFESEVFNNMKQNGHYDMFNYIMAQKEREKHLKEKYPFVKKAYEQYSLVLKLAESEEL